MDIQLRQQFPAAPDRSVAIDAAEVDIWLRQQFPAAPSYSVYPVRLWAQQPISGPAKETFVLGGTESLDAAAFAVTVTAGAATETFVLGATEAADVAAAALTLGHPFALTTSEALDSAAFALLSSSPVPAGGWHGAAGYVHNFPRSLRPEEVEDVESLPAEVVEATAKVAEQADREGLSSDAAWDLLRASLATDLALAMEGERRANEMLALRRAQDEELRKAGLVLMAMRRAAEQNALEVAAQQAAALKDRRNRIALLLLASAH